MKTRIRRATCTPKALKQM